MSNKVSDQSNQSAVQNKYLSGLITDFLEYCEIEKNLSQTTIRMYDFYLKRFLNWLNQERVNVSIPSDITDEVVRKYRLYLNRKLSESSNEIISRRTQKTHLVALRAFLRYLNIVKDLDTLPSDKVLLGKTDEQIPKFLTNEQLEEILSQPDPDHIRGVRDRAIMELLFSTGLRVSELASLNVEQVNLKTREFSVVGKGRKTRVVFLTDRAALWIGEYLALREDNLPPLFLRYSGPKPTAEDYENNGESMRLTVRSIQRMVKKYATMAAASLDVTPHVFRHSMATILLKNGADLRSVQEILGHSNVSTTQIYTHVTNKQLKETHRRFMED